MEEAIQSLADARARLKRAARHLADAVELKSRAEVTVQEAEKELQAAEHAAKQQEERRRSLVAGSRASSPSPRASSDA
eukprot:8693237-Lingulodinium_polyedra.AAC.1